MNPREMLIELLAIKLYEDHCRISKIAAAWTECDPEDRAMYRDMVMIADSAEKIYGE